MTTDGQTFTGYMMPQQNVGVNAPRTFNNQAGANTFSTGVTNSGVVPATRLSGTGYAHFREQQEEPPPAPPSVGGPVTNLTQAEQECLRAGIPLAEVLGNRQRM